MFPAMSEPRQVSFSPAAAEPRPTSTDIDVFGLSDHGRVRSDNQDQFLIASLHKLLARDDRILYPTHGSPIPDPKPFLHAYIDHRLEREAQVLACLREGIVPDEDTVDGAMIFATGFAPFRGGPMHYARTRGVTEIRQTLWQFSQRYGERFRPDPGWNDLA